MDGGIKIMEFKLFDNMEAEFEKTLSITMQREFYRLFGGVIKLNGRYEYLKTWREVTLIIDKEYWDTKTRGIYPITVTIIELIRLMSESVKSGENKILALAQRQNGVNYKTNYLFDIVKNENKKAYVKKENKGLKGLITYILKKGSMYLSGKKVRKALKN